MQVDGGRIGQTEMERMFKVPLMMARTLAVATLVVLLVWNDGLNPDCDYLVWNDGLNPNHHTSHCFE